MEGAEVGYLCKCNNYNLKISFNLKIKRVYISLCSKEEYQDKREKADTFFAKREREKTLDVNFYDADNIDIW